MAEIDDLKKWCDEARSILSSKGKDRRDLMKDRNEDVAKLLEKLKATPGLEKEYAALLREYELISTQAREAANKNDQAAVARASRDLSILKNTLRVQLAEDPTASKSTVKAGERAQKKLATPEKQGWATDKADREKDRLEDLASAVRSDGLMSQIPVDANDEEILASGLALARTRVLGALKTPETRTQDDINIATSLLAKVGEAIDKAEETARDRNAFYTRFNQFSTSYTEMTKVRSAVGIPAADAKEFADAEREVVAEVNAKKWPLARTKLDALELATNKVRLTYTAGRSYFDAYALIQPNFQEALKVYLLKAAKLAVPANAFEKTYGEMDKQSKAKDWVKAEQAVRALDSACTTLKLAGAQALADQPDFEIQFGTVLNLAEAQGISRSPPRTLVTAEVAVFREKYAAVMNAKNSGEFLVAKNAIPALKLAISNLIAANNLVKSKKLLYEQAMAGVTDYAAAKALAAANSPAVTDKIAAYTLADGNVDAKAKLHEWAAATGLVGALKTATEQLIAARGLYNTSYGAEKARLFQGKMTTVLPRTNVANATGPTTYIESLKAIVKGAVVNINSAASSGDFASAELLHAPMLLDLAKMEAAITEYSQHLIKFNAAKNGAVKTALEAALTPDKLAQERNKALAATKKRIEHFAAKGSISGKADPMVATWIEEANAWKTAQAASDNLNSGTDPDPVAMQTLANLPGGGKVLDALMDGLPEGKPEKFLKEAIKIRFGVNVTQFEKKNPDNLQDYTGLTPISPDAPDKSLKKMYQVFAKVPLKNVKGKIDQLIHFDEEAGGAAAVNKKIWMYCGRANDPNGSKQQFGVGVVADGDEIEEDFMAAKGNGIPDELPYFDFAAMHEVGHAVDEAGRIMADQPPGQIAGWQKHTRDQVAAKAATHFDYNLQFVKDTLASASSTPPTVIPPPERSITPTQWVKNREAVVSWCQSVRVGMSIWNNPALSKHVAIGDRVYQEAYDGDWVSYLLAARSKGITSYQFRSSAEWFAELYAAYFSGKLKKTHPYAEWLKPLKKIA